MSGAIPLCRLAKIVGLPRTELQRMVQSGELAASDGQVEFAEVLRAFPEARFVDETEIARVEGIKEIAVGKRGRDRERLPDPAILSRRLDVLGQDFARLEAALRHQTQVHGWLGDRLGALAEEGRLPPETAREIRSWLARELAERPEDSERWQRLVARERTMRLFSAQVRVQSKDIAFEAQGNETLLEAGLRAGLSFAYGCSNGGCGECKARLVSGEVVKLRPHDYRLTEAEAARGVALMCCYAPLGDMVIEAALPGADEIPEQTIEARVRAVEALGSRVVALHLLTPRSDRLQFLAGQRLRLRIGEAAGEVSIASCPCEERRIELHLVRGSELAVLAEGLRANETAEIAGPFGGFVLDDASARPLLFVAEGVGYAPIKGLLQHALSRDRAPSIVLHWFGGAEGLYQEALPRSYAAALDEFRYVPVSNPAAEASAAALATLAGAPELSQTEVYAAGSPEFLASLRALLASVGLPDAHYHEEPTAG